MPQANSTTSWPRVTSPRASRDDLAVLGGDDFGEFALAGVEQFAEREDDLGALGEGGVAPGGERGGGGGDGGVPSSTLARATWPVTAPVAGLVTGAVSLCQPERLLSIQCSTMFRESPQGWCHGVAS